ncbi:hypothetical protein ASZ90_017004 [hydrocarbon metagenome]|uniref:Uncharacterized protein n=1 Tax=hydrocarbon metagenome TaxID=938273 RepID=A0A0W8EAC4_9ZZZZ
MDEYSTFAPASLASPIGEIRVVREHRMQKSGSSVPGLQRCMNTINVLQPGQG